MAMANKIICVIGATGNQGGSVARRFHSAGFTVRALTRSPSSAAAKELSALGIQVVSADLNDVSSLKSAFRGANVIFSVTDFWEPFFRKDCRRGADSAGVSYRKFAYGVEYQQGKSIVEAAATVVDGLDRNGFLVSTLSRAWKCSGGLREVYHFDAEAEIFPVFVQQYYSDLAAKMSCIQTGYYFSSYSTLPNSSFSKCRDGTVEMALPTSPDKPVPHLDPVADMGTFTFAVYQMPPGKTYMAAGTTCTWPEWIGTWSRVTNIPARYRLVSRTEMIAATPDRDLGVEAAEMFSYSSDPGYDGGVELLKAEDLQAAGILCPMTTWEEWARRQDWSGILKKL